MKTCKQCGVPDAFLEDGVCDECCDYNDAKREVETALTSRGFQMDGRSWRRDGATIAPVHGALHLTAQHIDATRNGERLEFDNLEEALLWIDADDGIAAVIAFFDRLGSASGPMSESHWTLTRKDRQ